MNKLVIRKKKFNIDKFKPISIDNFIKKDDFTYSELRELFVSSILPLDYKNYKLSYSNEIFYISISGVGIHVDLQMLRMRTLKEITLFHSVREALIVSIFNNVNLYKTTDNFNYELLYKCLMSAIGDSYVDEALCFVNSIFDKALNDNKEAMLKNTISDTFDLFEKDNLPIGDVKNKIMLEVNNYVANKILA